jgi:hypothetical protein
MSIGFIGGFVLGLLVGSVLALVAMAKRGADAIELVAQGAGQLRDRAGGLVDQVRHVPPFAGSGRGEINGQTAPAIEREIDEAADADRVIETATGIA